MDEYSDASRQSSSTSTTADNDDDDVARQLLMAVACNMPVASVESLLSRMAHPDRTVDSDGNTALMMAAKNANLALVELLVRRGASVNRADTARQRTVLMCAVKTGNREIVETLLETSGSGDKDGLVTSEHVELDLQDADGTTAIMLAAKHGHCDVIEVLLGAIALRRRHFAINDSSSRPSSVDQRNKHGQTALHEASKRGHVAIAAALVFAGAKADCADRWLNRPLQYATLHGHTAVVALLARQPRNDVDAVNLGRRAALHTAAQNGHSDIAAILLDAGASTRLKDSDGDTPTLLAGRYQHRAVFELLVNATPVPGIFADTDSLGKNSFHYAAANGYVELVVCIMKRFTDYQNQAESRDYMLAPDWSDKKGNTALMLAVRRNHVEVVRILLQYNCSARRLWQGPGGQSYSLFGIALRHGYVRLLPLLADAGTDIRSCRYMTDISADILSNDDVTAWLHVITSEPRALIQMCRQRIRELLSCSIDKEVGQLPIPAKLQRYILQTE